MRDVKVLVVDDEKQVRDLLTTLLTGFGYFVEVAQGANEAVQKINAFAPDVVLTDIIMPEGEGIELIRSLTSTEHHPAIIVMSGHPIGKNFLRAGQLLGAHATLNKPFTVDELKRTLDDVSQNRSL